MSLGRGAGAEQCFALLLVKASPSRRSRSHIRNSYHISLFISSHFLLAFSLHVSISLFPNQSLLMLTSQRRSNVEAFFVTTKYLLFLPLFFNPFEIYL
jgi:hypothetical protein